MLVIIQITLLNFVHSKNFSVVLLIIEIRFLQGLQIRYFSLSVSFFMPLYIKNYINTCLNASAYDKILPIADTNFFPKKHFYSYVYLDNKKNLGVEHNFDLSLERCYCGVLLKIMGY